MVQGAKRERRRDEARTLQHGYVETSTMAKQEDTLRLRTVSRLDFGLDARSATKVSAANSRMWVYIYIYIVLRLVGEWYGVRVNFRVRFEYTEC